MLISKENRKAIYQALFSDGVLVAKKDYNAPKHAELTSIPNLEVIKACQSLNSRGYVKTQFAWQYYYYTLTNEGIEYLREYLSLPQEIVPATHKRQQKPQTFSRGGPRRGDREDGGGAYRPPNRGEYRRRDDGNAKEGGAPADFAPSFQRQGFGRGAPKS